MEKNPGKLEENKIQRQKSRGKLNNVDTHLSVGGTGSYSVSASFGFSFSL